MRAGSVLLVALLAACTSSPFAPFDSGRTVHCIVVASPAPAGELRIAPVFTVGAETLRCPERTIGARPVEVGLLRVPLGEHRISVWEPQTRCGGHDSVKVEGEKDLWLVLTLVPGGPGGVKVHGVPPDREIGIVEPLVAVPD